MGPSLSYRESMTGNYWRLDAPTDERAITVSFEASARDLVAFARDRTWRLRGTIDAERLASGREMEGTLAFKLFEERRVPYRFTFRGDDGRRYELWGQKEWRGVAPLESMTILPASLYDESGQELARATLRFDLWADLGWWIRSFRLRLSG
jgi:hypothetical protein